MVTLWNVQVFASLQMTNLPKAREVFHVYKRGHFVTMWNIHKSTRNYFVGCESLANDFKQMSFKGFDLKVRKGMLWYIQRTKTPKQKCTNFFQKFTNAQANREIG